MPGAGITQNIHELVNFLKFTHQEGDLYRGQNRDYPTMIPSFYRPFAKNLAASSSIADIDEIRFQDALKNNPQSNLRYSMMSQIIKDFGIGPGNIIAQQYGISSEALDVTNNIDVAAYFATRKYPSYAHITDDSEVGVIYRFRGLKSDGLSKSYSLFDLNNHFESGMSSTGYYDFFVHKHDMDIVFDRDKWWGLWRMQPSVEMEVWTPRFVSDWISLHNSMVADKERVPLNKPPYLGPYVRAFSWELTRFYAQSGGLIRPRIYWEADTPSKFDLAYDDNQAQDIRLRGTIGPRFMWDRSSHHQKWPLVIPSAAIKRRFLGVENLRANSACEPHLFKHSEKIITGFYRRHLWPEPSEDPLYGALWQLAIQKLFKFYGWEEEIPAIDDPEMGILDRGYRLDGEIKTRDARENIDLYRGQLEDATENRTYGPSRVIDCVYQIMPLLFNNDIIGAMRAAVDGLRIDPTNIELLLGLADCFGQKNKPRWEKQTIEKAFQYAPSDPWVLYRKSMLLTRSGEFEQAISLMDKAIGLYDPTTSKESEYFLLELRGILAWVTLDVKKLDEIKDELHNKGYSATGMLPQVEWLHKQFPEKIFKKTSD